MAGMINANNSKAIGQFSAANVRRDVRGRAQMCFSCPGVNPERRCNRLVISGLRGFRGKVGRVLGHRADMIVSVGGQMVYRLFWVVEHRGVAGGGHGLGTLAGRTRRSKC